MDKEITMNFHPRRGAVMPVTLEEAKRLADKWMSPGDVIQFTTNKDR